MRASLARKICSIFHRRARARACERAHIDARSRAGAGVGDGGVCVGAGGGRMRACDGVGLCGVCVCLCVGMCVRARPELLVSECGRASAWAAAASARGKAWASSGFRVPAASQS